jgi:hypothetical protein
MDHWTGQSTNRIRMRIRRRVSHGTCSYIYGINFMAFLKIKHTCIIYSLWVTHPPPPPSNKKHSGCALEGNLKIIKIRFKFWIHCCIAILRNCFIKFPVFWVVVQCHWVIGRWQFVRAWWCHCQGSRRLIYIITETSIYSYFGDKNL